MVENITLSKEQFKELLSLITNLSLFQTQEGNFSTCLSKFNGDKNSDVNAFIDAIETFKDCSKVSDLNALRGLLMLLQDFAAIWWQGVKDSLHNWKDAVALLRLTFGPKKPAYMVYKELFSKEQNLNTPADVFICHARSILALLPQETLSEDTQLDMVYGLLNKNIREKVYRDKITNFNDLLSQCRLIEQIFVDCSEYRIKTTLNVSLSEEKRIKCSFCKFTGHNEDQCRKKISYLEHQTNNKGNFKRMIYETIKKFNESLIKSPSSNQVSCFGCNRLRYIKFNCPSCTKKDSIDFCAFEGTITAPQPRPLLNIKIMELNGTGLIDTAAKQSVASHSLYKALIKKGIKF
ncbi:hypothetical protein ABEB36_015709 [Hypothenemus hampei]|uniref:Uncharacterized protein n=1 Tax=Hypothenemus hampei TaxID=57062 RepID=A0ABD1DZ62_HYPHA